MKNLIIVVIIFFSSYNLYAQLVTNQGQIIFSQENAIIKIEGSVFNDTLGEIDHNGLIIIDSSFIQNNTSLTRGFGIYKVFQNWDNSGIFIHDTSHVYLTGGLQNIQGDSVTDFYNLTLEGLGIKRQYVNAETSNILNLKANQLATDSFEMYISNPLISAIEYVSTYQNEGFVSSIDNGRLKRATNTTNEYIYPLGSSVGIKRFRSLLISPNTKKPNNYAAILINNDASADLLDRNLNDSTMCILNDLFYHKVENTLGGSKATLKVSYDPSTDKYWGGQATWNNSLWANNAPTTVNKPNNYSNVQKLNHDFLNSPIILITPQPHTPQIGGDSLICANNPLTTYSVLNGEPNYLWQTNGTIINGQGTSSITVNWGDSKGGTIYLISTNPTSGCASDTATFTTNLYPSPTAIIKPLSKTIFYPYDIIPLLDGSIGANSWLWDFSNGELSTNQNPQTTYTNKGKYKISLTVTNQYGCKDTTSTFVVIDGKIIIPNVFTPNGDGTNDKFKILGLSKYDLQILNRWGQTVYRGNANSVKWDGTTLSGNECTEGTYFYILNTDNENVSPKKGSLTLLR